MMNIHKIGMKLCRLCGKEKARGTDVFEDKIKGAVLVSIINKYFSKDVINVSISDTFSKYVCMDCEQKICSFDEYVQCHSTSKKSSENTKKAIKERKNSAARLVSSRFATKYL
ncbi:Protein of unknown function [Cotesia congregata]|uniref:ZAD domain-containing protein n=1 Tax=Cotesia congregata TaxID=51543 RepID=A0A8J2HIX9_COTCN|nr:Protein of unknown function [Cotesia congregata]